MGEAKKCPECKEGAPAWVVTFGDLMSLLMTFFVLLLSFATMEKPKQFDEFAFSIRSSFGVMPLNTTAVQVNPMPVRMKSMPEEVEDAARELERTLQLEGKADEVLVDYDASGALKISLPNEVLYAPGQAVLLPEAEQFLNGVGSVIGELPDAFFEVHGHTDNIPITSTTSPFRDNKDLSYARADAVMRYLSQAATIPIEQFQASAHGSGRPLESNRTEEGRIANRRVELFIRGLLTKTEIEQLKERVDALANQ